MEKKVFSGRVIFDHLPKTAGQATNLWLRNVLGDGSVTNNVIGLHKEIIRHYGGSHTVLFGHIFYNGEGLDPRYDYIGCLRDPIDRALSWLYFLINNHKPDELATGLYQAAKDFLNSDGEMGDPVTLTISNIYVEHFCQITRPDAEPAQERLSVALENARRYKICGFYEELSEFTSELAAYFQIPPVGELQRVNATRARATIEEVSAKLRHRLWELNSLDIQFYQTMREDYSNHKATRMPIATLPKSSNWKCYPAPESRAVERAGVQIISASLREIDHSDPEGRILGLSLRFALSRPIDEIDIGIHIFDEYDGWAFGTNSNMIGKPVTDLTPGTYETQFFIVPNLPDGNYRVGFALRERQLNCFIELAWFDKILDFQVRARRNTKSIGYSALPVMFTCALSSYGIATPIADAKGNARPDINIEYLHTDEQITMPVTVTNTSSQTWIGTLLKPLLLSYKWFDKNGEIEKMDGAAAHRLDQLLPHRSERLPLEIVAPKKAGAYKLVFALTHGDKDLQPFGFDGGQLPLQITTKAAARRYSAMDPRLVSEVGMVTKSGWTTSGSKGFLIFGPYIQLSAGKYKIIFQGTLDQVGTDDYIDVVDNINNVIARKNLYGRRKSPHSANNIGELSFYLKERSKALEFRIWVSAQATGLLESIILEPLNPSEISS